LVASPVSTDPHLLCGAILHSAFQLNKRQGWASALDLEADLKFAQTIAVDRGQTTDPLLPLFAGPSHVLKHCWEQPE